MRYRPVILLVNFFFLLFVLVGLLHAGQKQTLQAVVKQVKDGDTIVVIPAEGGQGLTCRLYGIDAPEVSKKGRQGQPYGEEAKRELKSLVLAQTITVETTGNKTYGREVCRIYKNGADINLEMVKRGYAWAFVEYLKRAHASEYIDAEREARNKRLGLWQQANPTPPWEWRRRK